MRFDLTKPEVKESAKRAEEGFPLLPEGEHLFRVSEVSYRDITNKQGETKPAWEIQLLVMPGEPHEHTAVRDTLFWTDKALGRALLVLSALGMKDAELSSIDPQDERCYRPLIGRTVIVEIAHSKPDAKGNIWANPTYAGYSLAHKGAIDEMRQTRASGGGAVVGGASGKASDPAPDYGSVPF